MKIVCTTLFVFFGMCSSVLYAQYHIKSFDISKKITALENTEDGRLQYGTLSGEIGTYDGLQFYKTFNVKGSVNAIKSSKSITSYYTSSGLYTAQNNLLRPQSPHHLNILAASQDQSFLVTTQGVFHRKGQDYLPDREEFFNINDIQFGGFNEQTGTTYLRIDNKVFKKDKTWKTHIIHHSKDFAMLSGKDSELILYDRMGLVSVASTGSTDTLLFKTTTHETKLFQLSSHQLLVCGNDSVGIFDLREKDLNNIYNISTELISTAVTDSWGNIWIAAGSFLFQIIERKNDLPPASPKIKIENILINGKSKDWTNNISLNTGSSSLEIKYNGVHLTFPQDLEFQTHLEGLNQESYYQANESQDWSKPTKETRVVYRNLQPGKYSFQLRASVDGKYFSYSKPMVIVVKDNTFLWAWWIGFFAAILVLLLAIFFNKRYNDLKQKSHDLRTKLLQENKMLSLQQKALQLQMNPHFIFNALNSIQGLIAKGDNQRARRYLQEFSVMMRSVLNHSRAETISLEDEVKYLKSYLHLEQMANNDSFDWEVEVDRSIEEDIHIPTMIIQPFIENAIVHGIRGLKERRGKIHVNFYEKGTNLVCKIVDNGLGRGASKEKKNFNHKSIAIDVVRERLSKKILVTSHPPIIYKDLIDDYSKPLGTEVVVEIPYLFH